MCAGLEVQFRCIIYFVLFLFGFPCFSLVWFYMFLFSAAGVMWAVFYYALTDTSLMC